MLGAFRRLFQLIAGPLRVALLATPVAATPFASKKINPSPTETIRKKRSSSFPAKKERLLLRGGICGAGGFKKSPRENFPVSSGHLYGLDLKQRNNPYMHHPNCGLVNISHGKNFKVMLPANLYGCTFGDDCFVGPFVEIQSDVRVGDRTRIQSHSFVCSKVSIGNDCFIGHGVMFVNDLFRVGRPSINPSDWGVTVLGDQIAVGSNATILPVRICAQTVIGAGSVVTKDILEPGIYAGNPARKLRALV